MNDVMEMRTNPCHKVREIIASLTIAQILSAPDKFPDQAAQLQASVNYLSKQFQWKLSEFSSNVTKRIDVITAAALEAKKNDGQGQGDTASKASRGSKIPSKGK